MRSPCPKESRAGCTWRYCSSKLNTQSTMVLAVVALIIVFTVLSPYFLSSRNFMNIGVSISIMGIMATGLTVTLLLGGLDISQYAVAALSGLVAGLLLEAGLPVGMVILGALATGVACGGINAFVITKMRVNPIIATLGTSLVFRATGFIVTDGASLRIDHPILGMLGRGYTAGLPNSIWLMAIVYLLFYFVLKHTPYGRKVFAVGGNPTASYLSGINVNGVRAGAYVISGSTAALAGLLMASQVGAAIPTAGQGAELDIIVAVLLGGISLAGGKGKIFGTLLGVLVIGILANGLTLLSVQAYYQMLFRGLVLVLALYLDTLRGGGYK